MTRKSFLASLAGLFCAPQANHAASVKPLCPKFSTRTITGGPTVITFPTSGTLVTTSGHIIGKSPVMSVVDFKNINIPPK